MQTNGTSGGGFAVEVRQNYENVVIESIARPRPFFFSCVRAFMGLKSPEIERYLSQLFFICTYSL